MSVTVLLADTGDMQRQVLEGPLLERGVELVSVANGAEALLMLKDLRPQALIANVVLSGVDGYSLCEMVKNDIELVQTRVLLIHDAAVDIDLARATEAGSDGILQKPFNGETLITYLESFGLAVGTGTVTEPVAAVDEVEPFSADAFTMATESPADAAQADADGSFDVSVSDDVSFADVTPPALEAEARDEMFSVEIAEEAPDETLILGDESEPEAVDMAVAAADGVTLAAEEPLEVSFMQEEGAADFDAVTPVRAETTPFDLAESAAAEERSTLLEGPAPAEPVEMASALVGDDLASREGRMLVEEIVRRLSDDVVREIAWEVVPELAERMIREALQKITR
jgi:CheY-like chemotaxis protein